MPCCPERSGVGSRAAAARQASVPSLQFVRCAYVIILMAIYWCTEVIPLAVTALMPALFFPLFKILDSKQVSSPRASGRLPASLPVAPSPSPSLSCLGPGEPDNTLFVGSLWHRDIPLTLHPHSKLP